MPVPANDITGNSRYRSSWFGRKLILQVETVSDGWRDARRGDVYVLGWIAKNPERWEIFTEARRSETTRRVMTTIVGVWTPDARQGCATTPPPAKM